MSVSTSLVRAPIVVILAAGQGTRMHSRRPKVLHELCGRPMVLWPVRAALEAGAAETVVVVDSPARALEPMLPEGVRLAVQQSPNGTGGRGGRRAALRTPGSAIRGARRGPQRRRAARRRRGDSRADRGALERRRRGHDGDAMLEDPSGYGRVVRDAGGRGARGRDQGPGDCHGRGARHRRGEHRRLRVHGAPLRPRCRG